MVYITRRVTKIAMLNCIAVAPSEWRCHERADLYLERDDFLRLRTVLLLECAVFRLRRLVAHLPVDVPERLSAKLAESEADDQQKGGEALVDVGGVGEMLVFAALLYVGKRPAHVVAVAVCKQRVSASKHAARQDPATHNRGR